MGSQESDPMELLTPTLHLQEKTNTVNSTRGTPPTKFPAKGQLCELVLLNRSIKPTMLTLACRSQ